MDVAGQPSRCWPPAFPGAAVDGVVDGAFAALFALFLAMSSRIEHVHFGDRLAATHLVRGVVGPQANETVWTCSPGSPLQQHPALHPGLSVSRSLREVQHLKHYAGPRPHENRCPPPGGILSSPRSHWHLPQWPGPGHTTCKRPYPYPTQQSTNSGAPGAVEMKRPSKQPSLRTSCPTTGEAGHLIGRRGCGKHERHTHTCAVAGRTR